MSRNRKAIVVTSFCLFGLMLFVPTSASADLLVWDLIATCPAGKKEVKLKMHYSVAGYWSTDPIKTSQKLHGCGGVCKTPGVLSSKVDWKKTGHSCYCLPDGAVVSSASECPPNNYAKCSETVEATLPYSCDELGYAEICTSATCEAKDDMMYGPAGVCAKLMPSTTANTCLDTTVQMDRVLELSTSGPTTDPTSDAELDELGGCSVGTANASLLTLLLLVAGLSLLLSRKRRR